MPVEVAPQLGRPHRGLEAERDRQPGLPVRAAEHQRVAMALGQREQRGLGRAQLAPRDRQHALHDEPEPRVGHVLDGGAVVDPLGARRPEPRRSTRIRPSVEWPLRARLLADGLEVERRPSSRGDLRRRRRRG